MSKLIEFAVDTEGNVKIANVEGYGAGCLEATKWLEKVLGRADETTRTLTDEINKPASIDASDYIEL